MDLKLLTYIVVGLSFALYIGVAIWARAGSTKEFYVAGGGVHPVVNGMATAADWMSAASFISMAGIIAFAGYDGSVYLMGWTGGYVLLAVLLAPYLRKFGKFTVPQFIGDRYYSQSARIVAVICLIFISFTYVAGQMRGVGIVFSRFLEVEITTGLITGMGLVFFYAVLGGMKGVTYTQVAQYVVLIFAYTIPAIFISLQITGNPLPQLGLGGSIASGEPFLNKLDSVVTQLGFGAYTTGSKSMIDITAITFALMAGTAGLPHVIVRFFTVPKVRDARSSAGWALVFIAILYTTAPAVGAMARFNVHATVNTAISSGGDLFAPEASLKYEERPEWMQRWEKTGLLKYEDKNGDGRIQYYNEKSKNEAFLAQAEAAGWKGNELNVDRDIMVLANPEVAKLPELGNRPGGRRWHCRRPVYRSRLAAGDFGCGVARPAQERVRAGPVGKRRADGRAGSVGGGGAGSRLPGLQPAGLCGGSGGVCLRPGLLVAIPYHSAGYLLQADEQGRGDCRHAQRPGLYLRLHSVLQGYFHYPAGRKRAGQLAVRHLAGRHRLGWRHRQHRGGLCSIPLYRPTTGSHPAPGGRHPYPARRRRGTSALNPTPPCHAGWQKAQVKPAACSGFCWLLHWRTACKAFPTRPW